MQKNFVDSALCNKKVFHGFGLTNKLTKSNQPRNFTCIVIKIIVEQANYCTGANYFTGDCAFCQVLATNSVYT